MPECPYPVNARDEVSGKIIQNSLYRAWHEGFEAHKIELANHVKKLNSLARILDNQIVKVNELQAELEKRKTEFQ